MSCLQGRRQNLEERQDVQVELSAGGAAILSNLFGAQVREADEGGAPQVRRQSHRA